MRLINRTRELIVAVMIIGTVAPVVGTFIGAIVMLGMK